MMASGNARAKLTRCALGKLGVSLELSGVCGIYQTLDKRE